MKGDGKYIRVWVYDANAKYLEGVDNQSRTVNEALAAYSHMQSGNVMLSFNNGTNADANGIITSTTTPRSSIVTTTYSSSTSTPTQPQALVCDNGHLMNAVTGKCVGKMCEYAKKVVQPK